MAARPLSQAQYKVSATFSHTHYTKAWDTAWDSIKSEFSLLRYAHRRLQVAPPLNSSISGSLTISQDAGRDAPLPIPPPIANHIMTERELFGIRGHAPTF
eukprot:4975309-Prymnesium_polylepis.1